MRLIRDGAVERKEADLLRELADCLDTIDRANVRRIQIWRAIAEAVSPPQSDSTEGVDRPPSPVVD